MLHSPTQHLHATGKQMQACIWGLSGCSHQPAFASPPDTQTSDAYSERRDLETSPTLKVSVDFEYLYLYIYIYAMSFAPHQLQLMLHTAKGLQAGQQTGWTCQC